jgi:hypothetical protein
MGADMSKSQAQLLLAVLNIAGFLGVVAVNALANALPLGGKTTGQLSDQYPNLFVPSGLTFLVWGAIYILLGIFVTYGLILTLNGQTVPFMRSIGLLFLITCIANAAWIFSWHYEVLPLSLICMLILLVTLAAIYVRLNIGRSPAGPAEKYLVHLPISVYFGWITIATIANVTALLIAYKWDRFGISEQAWAVLMIAIGTGLALLMLYHRNDLFYVIVVNWAVLGILIKRTADPQTPAQGIIIAAIICISAMTLAIIIQIVRGKVYR